MVPKQFLKRGKPLLRRAIGAVVLLPLFLAIYYVAYWLRFDGTPGEVPLHQIAVTIGWIGLLKVAVFGWFRVYQGWSRFVTFHDLVNLGKAATTCSLLLIFGGYLIFPSLSVPRSVLLMDWGMTILVVGGVLCLRRLVEERRLPLFFSDSSTLVFIVGANDSGEALLRAIRRNRKLSYRVIGFITQHAPAVGGSLSGVPVLGTLEETCRLAEKFRVSEVLITAGELSGQKVRRLVEQARRYDVHVKVLPSYEQLLKGTVDLRPRRVSIEDLLRRDPVQLNSAELRRWIDGQVVLVTGSAGSIGSELCRQVLPFRPKRLVAVDRSENGQFFLERELRELAPEARVDVCIADVNDTPQLRHIFQTYRPSLIFHAAAYKHVPLMESHPGEAVKNIAVATRRLADLADRYRASSFVLISTDKAVNPTSVMGTCKRVAELYVQALAPDSACRFVTVRFGNVLDSAGSVVPIFRQQIARGGPITVTHPEMQRYFMTIPEASQLVIQAGAMGVGGEIFVLDMGPPIRIVDLARDMIRLSGLKVGEDIEIEFSGMRPGEKLCEELYAHSDRHHATSHPKIMVVHSAARDLGAVRQAIDRLAHLAEGPPVAILAELQQIVPQFRRAAPSKLVAA